MAGFYCAYHNRIEDTHAVGYNEVNGEEVCDDGANYLELANDPDYIEWLDERDREYYQSLETHMRYHGE